MPKKQTKVYAFIDSQNLNLAIRDQGWQLDFTRFYIYLRDKFKVEKAFLFIGYVPSNADLYASLRAAGFVCIFRPTLTYQDGTTKGNCDAELVLQAMIEYQKYDKAVIVTGDGDFYCLVQYLIKNKKLQTLLVPNRYKYSALLKFKEFKPFTQSMNDLKIKLEYKRDKKKNPHKHDILQGHSSVGDYRNHSKKRLGRQPSKKPVSDD